MRLAGGLAGSDVDKRLREDLRGGGAVASGRADAVLDAEQPAELPALTDRAPGRATKSKPATRPGVFDETWDASRLWVLYLTGNDLLPKATRHARVRVSGGYSNRPSLVLQSHCWQSFVSAQDGPLACDNAKQPRIPVAKQTAIGEHNC